MKRILTLILTLMIAGVVIDCGSKKISKQDARAVVQRWYQERAAISADCKSQVTEMLSTVLAEKEIDQADWKKWSAKPENEKLLKTWQKHFAKKECKGADDKKKKKKKKKKD